jgi:uncharacterized protein YqeY
MSLQQQINTDIITAMKAKDDVSLRALRALKSALMIAATAEGAKDSVDNETAVKIFQKLAKQRKESIDIFVSNGREELAITEREELAVIERYLPKQMSESEVKAALQLLLAEIGATGAADFSKAMPLAMKALAGKADGKIISSLLKQLLG